MRTLKELLADTCPKCGQAYGISTILKWSRPEYLTGSEKILIEEKISAYCYRCEYVEAVKPNDR